MMLSTTKQTRGVENQVYFFKCARHLSTKPRHLLMQWRIADEIRSLLGTLLVRYMYLSTVSAMVNSKNTDW